MIFDDVRKEILECLIRNGFSLKGKNSAFKIMNGSFILVKPRKHTMSDSWFFVDYGIVYNFDGKKKPTNFFECHLKGEFSSMVNRITNEYIAWDFYTFGIEFFIEKIETFVLPNLEKVSSIEYISEHYPNSFDSYLGSPTSGANHDFLCSFAHSK